MRAAVILALTVTTAACSSCRTPSPQPIVDAVVDCTGDATPEVAALIVELQPLLSLQAPDWRSVYARALRAGKVIGGCALAQLVQDYLAPKRGLLPSDEATWNARTAFERFRFEVAGGATYRTPSGDL